MIPRPDREVQPWVSVIIPYYCDERRLELVLAGLQEQSLPPEHFEVIVADDGSPTAPGISAQPFSVKVLRQPDHGFRAAAARNLGAAAARGSVLCFLDADTVPCPGYLEEIAGRCHDGVTLAVGSRRHVDLTGWDASRVRRWLRGGPAPPRLTDPSWLADGYSATHNLARSDDTSFRYVISAVMAMPSTLFRHVGGFDETFVGYGGEDWELAQRCWLAGAELAHLPAAVGWHDGPPAAERTDFVHTKNRESARLATLLTHPVIRGQGLCFAVPDIAVMLAVTGWTIGQILVSVQSLLSGTDAGVWLQGAGSQEAALMFAEDPRVHSGEVPADVLRRCRAQVRVADPVAMRSGSLSDTVAVAAQCQPDGPTSPAAEGEALLLSTRAQGYAELRGLPHPGWRPLDAAFLAAVPPDIVVERWRAGDRGARDETVT